MSEWPNAGEEKESNPLLRCVSQVSSVNIQISRLYVSRCARESSNLDCVLCTVYLFFLLRVTRVALCSIVRGMEEIKPGTASPALTEHTMQKVVQTPVLRKMVDSGTAEDSGGGGLGTVDELGEEDQKATESQKWSVKIHPMSGFVYYENSELGISSWEDPMDPVARRAAKSTQSTARRSLVDAVLQLKKFPCVLERPALGGIRKRIIDWVADEGTKDRRERKKEREADKRRDGEKEWGERERGRERERRAHILTHVRTHIMD